MSFQATPALAEMAAVVVRQVAAATTTAAAAAAASTAAEDTPGNCVLSNDYDGRLGVRISAVFVILIGSLFGK